jgi:hypothetical protein
MQPEAAATVPHGSRLKRAPSALCGDAARRLRIQEQCHGAGVAGFVHMPRTARIHLIAAASFALAGLVTVASLAGIFVPAVYAKESASWAAQGVGQDWINLILVGPLVALCGLGVLRGSRRSFVVLAGALVYLVYSFVLYAFAVHFNVLFLVYCATLGISFYALLGLTSYLHDVRATTWFGGEVPMRRFGGVFLILVAIAFGGLWLSTVIPSLVRGAPPPELEETGLITNPVYVLDLAIVLPGILATGVLLLRNRGPGAVLAPIAASFNVLMTAALSGMMVAMNARGVTADLSIAGAMGVLTLISTFLLIGFLRPLRPTREAR